MQARATRRLLLVAAGLAAVVSAGRPAGADEAGWAALARPGAVAVMRHARAPGTGDPADFTLGDCATQRNLDAAGRAQARAIGAELRARGVVFERVYSSQWCRCLETAELLDVGPVTPLPIVNSFFGDRAAGPEQTRALAAFIAGGEADGRTLFVTHQVNITALTGVGPASGEIVALDVGADGAVAVAGRIRIDP